MFTERFRPAESRPMAATSVETKTHAPLIKMKSSVTIFSDTTISNV